MNTLILGAFVVDIFLVKQVYSFYQILKGSYDDD